MSIRTQRCLVPVLLVGVLVLAAGCASEPKVVQQTFATPEEAAEAFVAAAEQFDVEAMKSILGSDSIDLVVTRDEVADRNQAAEFTTRAREMTRVERRSDDPKVADLFIGDRDWPVPVPIVEENGRWRLDAAAGREEILTRRIGSNELDAIELCHGYVEAQLEYASERRGEATINQYAQSVISSEGKQDGLAWLNSDGSWGGPVGEGVARVIADGHTSRFEPFNGYYFKILTGQGSSAPMGEMDFMVDDVMIGGFALVAVPADYELTGIMTFIVSHDGIIHEQDLGPESIELFKAMERYDPGPGWTPVTEE
jgi:hypothetical protein